MWKTNSTTSCREGTVLHERIELFMNDDRFGPEYKYSHRDLYEINRDEIEKSLKCDEPKDWKFFLQFVRDHPDLVPYRTEWMIYDEELKLAGSIDMVYENPDGTLMIYDWKRCKEIVQVNNWNKYATNPLIKRMPDCNFWHYSLQLNTYKAILERKYGKTVTKLCLVRLHPTNEGDSYELIDVPALTAEIDILFKEQEKKFVE
jgi:ATP-dependent exoDNAse (exonuclease V) beta subunit